MSWFDWGKTTQQPQTGGFDSIDWSGAGNSGWSDWFNPQSTEANPKARASSPSPEPVWGPSTQPPTYNPNQERSPWWGIGQEFLKGILPGVGAGLVAQGFDQAFPGEPQKLVATDVRTQQGNEAEQMRLASAHQLQGEIDKGLADPYYGSLPPEVRAQQEQEIRRDARASAAARGILETGRTAEEESRRLIDYRAKLAEQRLMALNSRFGQLQGATTGYQGENVTRMEGVENPWSKLGGHMAAGFGKGIEKALARWE